jgi:hypothetical protein
MICVCGLTGSQPFAGEKPSTPQPTLKPPEAMSLTAVAAVEYSQGFKKPSGDLPAWISWSLSRLDKRLQVRDRAKTRDCSTYAIVDAHIGVEQLVPYASSATLLLTTAIGCPEVRISLPVQHLRCMNTLS